MANRWVARMVDGEFKLIPIEDVAPTVRTQILTDTIEPTWHPATGEYCSSRTGMVKIAKQHGLEELGNDRLHRRDNYDKGNLKETLIRAANGELNRDR
jgi:hypothetical protein